MKKPARAAREPSGADKAAFVKAMMDGIKPGTAAAKKSAAKKHAANGQPATQAASKAATKGGPKAASPKAKAPTVEILRRIPAAPAPRATPEGDEALRLAGLIESALAEGRPDLLPPHAMQALMAALVKAYAACDDAGDKFPIVAGRGALTGTDAMVACGALLKAVDLQVFELGMWQSWSAR